jgi:hypothetical protein
MRKALHILWVGVAHVVVLIAAHHIASHIGAELVSLVRDEWAVTIADRLFALGE